MVSNQRLDRLPPEESGVIGRAIHQNLLHHRAQAASQPIVRRNVESDLLPLENRSWQLIAHQFLQKNLLSRTMNLQRSRQGRGKFYNSMIKKWRPHFQRVRHAHAVRLIQNIVGKKISLIEPQIRREIIVCFGAITQFAQNAVERGRQFRMHESRLVRFGEGSVPVDMRAIGTHQRAF